MEPQFPGNSKRPISNRDEPKKVERVVEGEVVRRKTPIGRRLSQNLIGGDAQSVWGFMFGEVLIPAVRDMVYDAFTGGMERAIFGDNAPSRGRGRGHSRSGHTPYNQMSSRGRNSRDEPRRELSRRARSNHSLDEIVIPTRVEAEEVLDRMDALLDKFDSATVADFYELCGISGNYTDNKYGWTDIGGASIHRNRGRDGGYVISMPRPEPLD